MDGVWFWNRRVVRGSCRVVDLDLGVRLWGY